MPSRIPLADARGSEGSLLSRDRQGAVVNNNAGHHTSAGPSTRSPNGNGAGLESAEADIAGDVAVGPEKPRQVLQTCEITKTYRGRKVVDDVSIAVEEGQVVGLLGPNGAGKTTSFYMMVGLVSPDSGRVMLDAEDITSLPMYLRARRGISYLPQEASIFRKLTVEENLLAILETMRLNARERHERMNQLIEQLGLEKVRRNKGYTLSGGERRRVEIARSLVIHPHFLLLDEPFSGIDPIQVLELQRIISDLKRAGIGILVTDHNVRETLAVTDRAYIISNGRIFRAGTPEALSADPEVRRVYLGENFSW
ncbi:MAG TPA: LPS export ABC transporter ATP-binding protein [Bryobacteraceae bacterium]|nr:LPS export ABC transporter ATP-binding protein [Bryobacteraceae bacterium]